MIGSVRREEEREIVDMMMSESLRGRSSMMIQEDVKGLADVGDSFPIHRIR